MTSMNEKSNKSTFVLLVKASTIDLSRILLLCKHLLMIIKDGGCLLADDVFQLSYLILIFLLPFRPIFEGIISRFHYELISFLVLPKTSLKAFILFVFSSEGDQGFMIFDFVFFGFISFCLGLLL